MVAAKNRRHPGKSAAGLLVPNSHALSLVMFATAPKFFGREGEVVLGKKSGKAFITCTLEKPGIENVSDETGVDILKEVKQKGTEKRSLLTIEEFKEIVDRKVN